MATQAQIAPLDRLRAVDSLPATSPQPPRHAQPQRAQRHRRPPHRRSTPAPPQPRPRARCKEWACGRKPRRTQPAPPPPLRLPRHARKVPPVLAQATTTRRIRKTRCAATPSANKNHEPQRARGHRNGIVTAARCNSSWGQAGRQRRCARRQRSHPQRRHGRPTRKPERHESARRSARTAQGGAQEGPQPGPGTGNSHPPVPRATPTLAAGQRTGAPRGHRGRRSQRPRRFGSLRTCKRTPSPAS